MGVEVIPVEGHVDRGFQGILVSRHVLQEHGRQVHVRGMAVLAIVTEIVEALAPSLGPPHAQVGCCTCARVHVGGLAFEAGGRENLERARCHAAQEAPVALQVGLVVTLPRPR